MVCLIVEIPNRGSFNISAVIDWVVVNMDYIFYAVLQILYPSLMN
jgi:hypothetical protein